MKEHRLKLFKNRVLRIFEPKRKEVREAAKTTL
jgi:hypothetical protein